MAAPQQPVERQLDPGAGTAGPQRRPQGAIAAAVPQQETDRIRSGGRPVPVAALLPGTQQSSQLPGAPPQCQRWTDAGTHQVNQVDGRAIGPAANQEVPQAQIRVGQAAIVERPFSILRSHVAEDDVVEQNTA